MKLPRIRHKNSISQGRKYGLCRILEIRTELNFVQQTKASQRNNILIEGVMLLEIGKCII